MAKKEEVDDDKGKEPELTIVTDDEKNLEVDPTGPQTDDVDIPPVKKTKEPPKGEPEEDDEEPEEEDSRVGQSEEMEAEAEAKEKAKTHKSRRQRRREAELRLRSERDFLERRNEVLEKEVMGLKKRMDSTDKSTLEARIQHTRAQIARAEKIAAEALTAGKGDENIEALRIRDNLRDHLRNMEERKVSIEKEPEESPPDPRVVQNASAWMARTKWFDPKLRDQDSKVVRALDLAVNEDGFDPGTPEYFEELDRRIKRYLPHRASKKAKDDSADEDIEDDEEEQEDERPQRRKAAQGKENLNGKKPSGGPRFRTGGPGRDLKANEVYLNPARIAAMKEAGVWDDPVTRQKYLKKYQQWDQEHGQQE